jgi:prepilin-type N-terminal cleavage/methylation domain-containing protein
MSFRFETALSRVRRTASRGRKSGFTLVELLVVISIIGMLMALLLPQIQSARETARGNTCRNNLRSLAVAAFNYQTRNGSYPGYMNVLQNVSGDAFKFDHSSGLQSVSGTTTPVSWAVMLFPDIDRQGLYDQWRINPADTNTPPQNLKIYIEQLVCASDPAPSKTLVTPISYVVNTGQQDALVSAASGTWRDPQSSGMFFDAFTFNPLSGNATSGRTITMRDELCRDPKDKTVLMTENVDARNYMFDLTNEGGSNNWLAAEAAVGSIFIFGTCSQTGTTSAPIMTPNSINTSYTGSFRINSYAGSGLETDATAQAYAFARPSSKHPQLVNIAFVGQNVQAMRDSLSYYVFAKLMATDDKNITNVPGGTTVTGSSVVLFKNYQLSDADVNP